MNVVKAEVNGHEVDFDYPLKSGDRISLTIQKGRPVWNPRDIHYYSSPSKKAIVREGIMRVVRKEQIEAFRAEAYKKYIEEKGTSQISEAQLEIIQKSITQMYLQSVETGELLPGKEKYNEVIQTGAWVLDRMAGMNVAIAGMENVMDILHEYFPGMTQNQALFAIGIGDERISHEILEKVKRTLIKAKEALPSIQIRFSHDSDKLITSVRAYIKRRKWNIVYIGGFSYGDSALAQIDVTFNSSCIGREREIQETIERYARRSTSTFMKLGYQGIRLSPVRRD
jgi:hypothetical protein